MRLLRLTALPTAAVLVLALVPSAASATSGRALDRGRSGSTPAATRALAAVQAAFAPKGPATARRSQAPGAGTDVTLLLLDLRKQLGGLAPQDRRTAQRYLARPTDGDAPYGAGYSRRARPTSDCALRPRRTPRFCVHWAQRTDDAPRARDRDRDGIPNQVEKTRRVVRHVWRREVTRGGYRAPLKDGTRGGNGRLDVYLADIGDAGVYGYCVSERRVRGRAYSAYCVLDDDYSRRQFPAETPGQNLKVTAAHEFFHAVQFAYDAWEDPWFMESTSTWVEDEIYDAINDNRFYLSQSPLRMPSLPLDYDRGSLRVYGDWIFWRYLTERFPRTGRTGLPLLVRRTWENADASSPPPDRYSLKALDLTLGALGKNLAQLYADFSVANRHPAASYEEGADYRSAPLTGAYPLDAATTQVKQTVAVDHLSSVTYAFRPGTGSKRLSLLATLPGSPYQPVAQAVVVYTDGSLGAPVQLTSGQASTLDFDAGTVSQVELTLTNGGHRFSCWSGTDWSCSGQPRDDNVPFTFKAVRQTS